MRSVLTFAKNLCLGPSILKPENFQYTKLISFQPLRFVHQEVPKSDSNFGPTIKQTDSITEDKPSLFSRILKGDPKEAGGTLNEDPNLKTLSEQNKKYEESINELNDKYKRALADMQNLRVRMDKELEKTKLYSIQSFCKDLISVADILAKAFEVIPPHILKSINDVPNELAQSTQNLPSSNTENANFYDELAKNFRGLHEGLSMTNKELLKVFSKHGLVQIIPHVGDKFDPNIHEALFETPANENTQKPGHISICTKTGYQLKDRTIRPALVGVFTSTD